MIGRLGDPRADLVLGWVSRQRRALHSPARSPSSFACSCCVFVFPFLSPVSAGVAVSLTPLATTAQLAHGLECWGGAGFHWKVPLLASVVKQGAVTTNIFVRDLAVPNTLGLEVVVDGLPLCGGAQLAVDTTMVSPSSWRW